MNAWKNWTIRLGRCLYFLAVTASIWLVMAGTALARRDEPEAPPEKSYGVPYILVVLCVALGLMVVCRPSRRSNEPKIKDEEE